MKTFDDKSSVPEHDKDYQYSDDIKVKTPANLIKLLDDVIDQLIADGKEHEPEDGHTFNDFELKRFYNDTADAFKHLKDLLKAGDDESFKRAQLFASSLMTPMQTRIPSELWLFLVSYQGKKTLKTAFNQLLKAKKNKEV